MNVNLAVSYSTTPGFPAGSVVDHVLCTLVGSNAANNQSQSVAPGTTSVSFANVAADTYTVSAVAQDASGNSFGSPATTTITVTAPTTVTLSLPSGVTASQV